LPGGKAGVQFLDGPGRREAAVGHCEGLSGGSRFAKRATKLLNERASRRQIREAPAKISFAVPCYGASVPRLNALRSDYPMA